MDLQIKAILIVSSTEFFKERSCFGQSFEASIHQTPAERLDTSQFVFLLTNVLALRQRGDRRRGLSTTIAA
jgi:hypothetical protein